MTPLIFPPTGVGGKKDVPTSRDYTMKSYLGTQAEWGELTP